MLIERLDVYRVDMPLIYPWRTAYGEDYSIQSVLVKASSGDIEAWAEVSPLTAPTYLTEGAGAVFYNISEIFGPQVVGHEYDTPEELNERLAVFKGNTFAKGGLELCWWMLRSAETGTPLHRLIGGETREVAAGADFGIQDSIDMLLGNIQQAVDAGFPRIKLKVGRGWDLDMLQAVTSTFPKVTFHIDCNSGYTLEDLDFFKAIDPLGLAFIEQPLGYDDVLDHAELAKQIKTPICLDETIIGIRRTEQALSVGACEYVNIKPGRVGGLANSIAIHDICRDAGVPVWVGGMLESALGAAICIELATLPNFTYPGDLFPSSRFYAQDLCSPSIELTPQLTFEPFTNGLPAPDPERLEDQTLAYKAVTAQS